MSEVTKNAQMMSDEALGEVAGGMSRDLIAAYDVMAGKYGVGEDRKARLAAAGYDYWAVQQSLSNLINIPVKSVPLDPCTGFGRNALLHIGRIRAYSGEDCFFAGLFPDNVG